MNKSTNEYMNKISVIKQIAYGSFSNIYLAENNNKKIVIKKILKKIEILDENEIFETFNKSEFYSPYIIKCFKYTQANDLFILEYFESITLKDFVFKTPKEYKHLHNADSYANIMFKIFKGVEFIHGCNVVHRDIKSENILINEKGDIKIIDFGLSKLKTNDKKENKTVGTPLYLPIESFVDTKISYYDYVKQDIWSLGVIFYLLLFKEYPYDVKDSESLEPAKYLFIQKLKNERINCNYKDSTSLEYSNDWFSSLVNCLLEKNKRLRISIKDVFDIYQDKTIYDVPIYGKRPKIFLFRLFEVLNVKYDQKNLMDSFDDQLFTCDINYYLNFYNKFYKIYTDIIYNDMNDNDIIIKIKNDLKKKKESIVVLFNVYLKNNINLLNEKELLDLLISSDFLDEELIINRQELYKSIDGMKLSYIEEYISNLNPCKIVNELEKYIRSGDEYYLVFEDEVKLIKISNKTLDDWHVI